VRQVFFWFVYEAKSIGWIARQLTSLGVAKGHNATKPGWHHQQVHRMLCNPKYVGKWPWGTTRTLRSSEGKTKQVAVPAEQRIVRERPELQIIDQSVWERAQRRLSELTERFGVKPGQKPRGPRPHHTDVYPKSLLGGVLYCRSCGSRLWVQRSGNYSYLGCPGYRKRTCSMSSRVVVPRAENAILGFVSELLSAWPGWLESAARVMRSTVNDFASKIPKKVQGDRDRVVVLEKQIKNLVDLLANGSKESAALRARLDQTELEAEQLRARIAEAESTRLTTGAIPDDAWIVEKLRSLAPLLRSDPGQASLLLRRLLGHVTAEAVVAPGKSRGFIRLRFRISGIQLLKEALGGMFPDGIIAAMNRDDAGGEQEFQIDLGEPTRLDRLAPEIAALREQGVPWAEIEARTGLQSSNAYNVWKRWVDAQAAERAHPA
jgi:site-specific DNA recombinase